MTEGCWSIFETVVLQHTLSLAIYKTIGCLLKLYNDIVYYSTASFAIYHLLDNVVQKHMPKYWQSSNLKKETLTKLSTTSPSPTQLAHVSSKMKKTSPSPTQLVQVSSQMKKTSPSPTQLVQVSSQMKKTSPSPTQLVQVSSQMKNTSPSPTQLAQVIKLQSLLPNKVLLSGLLYISFRKEKKKEKKSFGG